jgi:hypothetical protein
MEKSKNYIKNILPHSSNDAIKGMLLIIIHPPAFDTYF